MQQDKDWCLGIIAVMWILALLCIGIIFVNEIKDKNEEIKRLEEENLDLALSLKQTEDDMYEIALELQRTNETLADTAYKLTNAEADILEYEYIGEYTITAYCCEKYPHICGGGKTASGTDPVPDLTCAVCDLEMFPFGTVLYIEGIGIRVVQDTGGFDFSKIDVAVKTHEEASHWQNAKHKVWIVKEK